MCFQREGSEQKQQPREPAPPAAVQPERLAALAGQSGTQPVQASHAATQGHGDHPVPFISSGGSCSYPVPNHLFNAAC